MILDLKIKLRGKIRKMEIVLYGRPITKKNSQRIVFANGRKMLLPSKQYIEFEKNCLKQITGKQKLNIQDRNNNRKGEQRK